MPESSSFPLTTINHKATPTNKNYPEAAYICPLQANTKHQAFTP